MQMHILALFWQKLSFKNAIKNEKLHILMVFDQNFAYFKKFCRNLHILALFGA
jgi:hypothetical protein